MASVFDEKDFDAYDIQTSHTGRLNRDGEYTVYMQEETEDICGFCSIINAMFQLERYFEYLAGLPNGTTVTPADVDSWLRSTTGQSPYRSGPDRYGLNQAGVLALARTFMTAEAIVEPKKAKKVIREELNEGRKVIAGINWMNGGGHYVVIVDVQTSTLPWANNTWTVLDSLSGTESIKMPTKDGFIIYENKRGMKGYLDTTDLISVL